jgi:hypothetical protein
MDIETVRRLTLARHLYELGSASSRSGNDIHLFSAVNLFQDAVESFLVAVADHVGAVLDQNTNFDQYFVKIDAKIAPNVLPFKNKLIRLNKVRVSSKHYGIQPERNECSRLALTVREFFDEVSNSVLGASFSTVSAIDLLRNGETKIVLLVRPRMLLRLENLKIVLFVAVKHFSWKSSGTMIFQRTRMENQLAYLVDSLKRHTMPAVSSILTKIFLILPILLSTTIVALMRSFSLRVLIILPIGMFGG